MMATLGRSLKSPAYLSRAARPAMSPRAFSNSSDVSVASTDSRLDDSMELPGGVMSGVNTPAREKTQAETLTSPIRPSFNRLPSAAADPSDPAQTLKPASRAADSLATNAAARSSRSNPITIDLPQFRACHNGSNYTPPEPLSARGDVPGGYFPRHEDPEARLHRPHPFSSPTSSTSQSTKTAPSTKDLQKTSKSFRRQPHPTIQLSSHPPPPRPIDHSISQPVATTTTTTTTTAMAESTQLHAPASASNLDKQPRSANNTPVASWMPSGAHDTSLPMGKYYPSNYERMRQQQSSKQSPVDRATPTVVAPRPAPAPTLSSSVKSDSNVPTRSTDGASGADSDVRRKLLQYQRDMIAQARIAASEVLGDPSTYNSNSTAAGPLNGIPSRNLRHFGGANSTKPISPRLIPLGSPGPVTPMDLEGGEGGYLDRGLSRAPHSENEIIARAAMS